MELLRHCYYCCVIHLLLPFVLFPCASVSSEELFNASRLKIIKHDVELAAFERAMHPLQASYKLEDFFWTGSGDGTIHENEDGNRPTDEEYTSEDYFTSYTTRTVFVTPATTIHATSSTTMCHSCDAPIDSNPEHDDDLIQAEKEFWLLTVLKTDGEDPDVIALRHSLENLYRKAFLRQQAKHLGIRPSRIKRHEKPVSVHIHRMRPDGGRVEVIYHVAVAGQPVDAATAAEDMRLVTDSEVKEALGYAFVVKAEPYIKPTVAQELAEVRSTWLFVSVALIILIILMMGSVAAIAFCVKKRQRSHVTRTSVSADHAGHANQSYEQDDLGDGRTPTYINFRSQPSNETLNSLRRLDSPLSSSTLSSNGSIDISPLMQPNKTRRITQRPKAALNKTAPMDAHPKQVRQLSESTNSSTSTLSDPLNHDPGVISPTSYLSMPSVKAFPKGDNPEPLHKVLQPLSVHHLDMLDDEVPLKRQGSLGPREDPGVIGPIVWNLHKHRMQRGLSLDNDDDLDETGQPSNVSRMRKRFHDLLDDTFSLFGSRRESPHRGQIHVKSYCGGDKKQDASGFGLRPKTTEARRSSEAPKGAWMSVAPSPLVRPISAPNDRPYTAVPQINRDLILVDGVLQQGDPAIPLIEEIKKEIGRYSTTPDECK